MTLERAGNDIQAASAAVNLSGSPLSCESGTTHPTVQNTSDKAPVESPSARGILNFDLLYRGRCVGRAAHRWMDAISPRLGFEAE